MNLRKRKNWNEEEISCLIKKYDSSSEKELMDLFPERTWASISWEIYKLKLKKSDPGKHSRKGNLTSLLDDSNQTIYWIGYIFADGYINHKKGTIQVSCALKDRNHLEQYAKYVNSQIVNCKNYSKIICCVSVGHKPVVSKLIHKYDFKPRKTYNPPNIKALKNILTTREKFVSFLVGFIDGDGNITTDKRNYTVLRINNHSSWNKIHNYFIDRLKYYKLYNGIGVSHIGLHGYSEIQLRNVPIIINKEKQKLDIPNMERKWGFLSKLNTTK